MVYDITEYFPNVNLIIYADDKTIINDQDSPHDLEIETNIMFNNCAVNIFITLVYQVICQHNML